MAHTSDTMEKPVTPEKRVDAIKAILGVEAKEPLIREDENRVAVLKMVRETDEGTLKKIQALLAK